MPSLRARWTRIWLTRICPIALCLVISLSIPAALHAQSANGRIVGRVWRQAKKNRWTPDVGSSIHRQDFGIAGKYVK